MKEYPILFRPEMVRARLSGLKTQTRRIPTPYNSTIDGPSCNLELWKTLIWDRAVVDPGPSPAGNPGPYWKVPSTLGTTHRIYCRYQVDDILWVKETIALETWTYEYGDTPPIPSDRPHFHHVPDKQNEFDQEYWDFPHYRATDPAPDLCYEDGREGCRKCEDGDPHAHWIPSIHMPRWASRILLRVASVRAQRIQEISEVDCESDLGYALHTLGGRAYPAFQDLWDLINAERGYAWDTNPPVWAIGF